MLLLLFITLAILARPAHADFPGTHPAAGAPARATAAPLRGYSGMSFEVNRGQADARVNFLARGLGYSLFLTPTQAVFLLQEYRPDATGGRPGNGGRRAAGAPGPPRTAVVRMDVVGARARAAASGGAPLPGRVNYLVGSDPRRWRLHIPLYASVRYRRIYPGVDLLYHGTQRQLEYDFIVAPRARPGAIRLRFRGASAVTVGPDGGLVVGLGGRAMRWRRPALSQMIGGARRPVAGGYVLGRDRTVSFRVGDYDPSRPLVIDPVLAYATYLGGRTVDKANAVAVDSAGCAYIAGASGPLALPGTEELFSAPWGTSAFVTKLDPTGAHVLYSTYIGTPGTASSCTGIAVDAEGDAYFTGRTQSRKAPGGGYVEDFPTTPGAFQGAAATADQRDTGFVAELAPDGSHLLYGTFFGTGQGEGIFWMALDGGRHVYLAGNAAVGIPLTARAIWPRWPASTPPHSLLQGFVAKLDLGRAGRDALVYSTLIGGQGSTGLGGLAVDADGRAVVTGVTCATDFPTTPGALQRQFAGYDAYYGPTCAFVAELDPTGSRMVYASFLGAGVYVEPVGVAVGPAGHIYVIGTAAPGLPTTPAALQPASVNYNPFVLEIAPDRSGEASLRYGTYLGGPGRPHHSVFDKFGVSHPSRIAVDPAGDAYVAGDTDDAGFPTTADAIEASYNPREQGSTYLFLSILDPTGSRLLWSSYLGEGGYTFTKSLALDRFGDAYLAGMTTFDLLPTTPGAYLQFPPGGQMDGFALKVSGRTPAGPYIANVRPYPVFAGDAGQMLTVTGTGFVPGSLVSFNGGPPVPAAVSSPTRLTVPVPDALTASPQPVLVTVVNPPGGDWASAILPVIDPAPAITRLSPNPLEGPPGWGYITIYGSGMFPGTVVSFNGGTPVAIQYGTPHTSFVNIPPAVLAHPGSVDVAVINPAPRRGEAHTTLVIPAAAPPTTGETPPRPH